MKKLLELNRKIWTGFENAIGFISIIIAVVVCSLLEIIGVDTALQDNDEVF